MQCSKTLPRSALIRLLSDFEDLDDFDDEDDFDDMDDFDDVDDSDDVDDLDDFDEFEDFDFSLFPVYIDMDIEDRDRFELDLLDVLDLLDKLDLLDVLDLLDELDLLLLDLCLLAFSLRLFHDVELLCFL